MTWILEDCKLERVTTQSASSTRVLLMMTDDAVGQHLQGVYVRTSAPAREKQMTS